MRGLREERYCTRRKNIPTGRLSKTRRPCSLFHCFGRFSQNGQNAVWWMPLIEPIINIYSRFFFKISDVSSETGMAVRHAAVASMWRHLGEYETPLADLAESSHNRANQKPRRPDPRSDPAYRHQRELQMWIVWANGIRQQAKHIPPGEGMQVGGFDGEPVTLTRDNVEEVITASKPEPGSLRKWSDPSYNHQDN